MRKFTFITVFILFAMGVLAQSPGYYLPNGEMYSGNAKTVGELENELSKGLPTYSYICSGEEFNNKIVVVTFKLFTNDPLYIFTEDKSLIDKAIKSFNLEKFFNSFDFTNELDKHIENKDLSDLILVQTLGKPSSITESNLNRRKVSLWTYTEKSIQLTLFEGILVGYTKIH